MSLLRNALIAVVVLLGIYLNYPAPEASKEMKEWVASGKYFKYKGHKIFYKNARGKRQDGPSLLLLHGFPSHSYDWIKVLPALQEKFNQVLMFDFIGFGYSDKPADYDYSIMDQADIAEKLLASLKIPAVHILAHDYGDTVAQELLARFNGKSMEVELSSVCLLNGGIFPETNFPRFTQKILLVPYLGHIASRLSGWLSFKRSMSSVFGPETQPSDDDLTDWWAAIRYQDGHNLFYKLIQYIPERRANRERWVKALQEATIPVHVVYGPADPVNPPGFVDYYKEIIPAPSISVLASHVGHYPQWEEPRFTMRQYFDFLAKLPYK